MSQLTPDVEEFLSYPEQAREKALRLLRELARIDDCAEHACKQPFDSALWCPLCGTELAPDGSCEACKVQFVGIEQHVADRVDFNVAARSDEAPPAYRSFWDMDDDGCAIMCFQSRSTEWRVWLPCFVNYLDSFGEKQTRFPYWFREQQLDARTVQTLADLTDEQFKERAAHLPGRTAEHRRKYDSDAFQREYYWVWMDRRMPWQTRAERKALILDRHHNAGCKTPGCMKRH